jgi:L,D-transpeptidase YcbB
MAVQKHTTGIAARVALALLVTAFACSKTDSSSSSNSTTVTPPKQVVAATARDRIREVLNQAHDSATVLTLTTGDTVHLSTPTLQFYRGVFGFWNRGMPAWNDGEKLTDQGKKLLTTIGHSSEDGIAPERYRYDVAYKIQQALETSGGAKVDDQTRAGSIGDLDLLITEAWNRYALDLAQGTLDPDSSGHKWLIRRNKPSNENLLKMLTSGTEPEQVVDALRPNALYYRRMMATLARFDSVKAKGGWPAVSDTSHPSIVQNSSTKKGSTVSPLAARVRARFIAGEDEKEAAMAAVGQATPTKMDADLAKAIKHFQDRNGIEPTGKLDAKTLIELNHSVDDRISDIKLNLDRWRWLPHDLGKLFVIVNVAGYELNVVEDNKVIDVMNVVVGKPGWETPIFGDTMEDVVANPSWNVPISIVKEEILPNIGRNPNYLAEHNFVRSKDGGYRQVPGLDNALGKWKFEFPNKDNIYLHDTPAHSLFSRAERSFSHGCIRLEHPAELAELLIGKASNTPWSTAMQYSESGEERVIHFNKKIPIYIMYFTTWVDEDGTVNFFHDVYGKDRELEGERQKLETPAAANPRVS